LRASNQVRVSIYISILKIVVVVNSDWVSA